MPKLQLTLLSTTAALLLLVAFLSSGQPIYLSLSLVAGAIAMVLIGAAGWYYDHTREVRYALALAIDAGLTGITTREELVAGIRKLVSDKAELVALLDELRLAIWSFFNQPGLPPTQPQVIAFLNALHMQSTVLINMLTAIDAVRFGYLRGKSIFDVAVLKELLDFLASRADHCRVLELKLDRATNWWNDANFLVEETHNAGHNAHMGIISRTHQLAEVVKADNGIIHDLANRKLVLNGTQASQVALDAAHGERERLLGLIGTTLTQAVNRGGNQGQSRQGRPNRNNQGGQGQPDKDRAPA
ncbi:MAG: hypothetical protein GC129_05825 [Proteobacteria bacterium]|nr:hypothetical protein [Pseudomonadota bacterium]